MSTVASRKQKGRRAQQFVRDLLLEKTKKYGLVFGDIESTSLGVSGVDIKLSPLAKTIIPFSIEVKNQEKINLNSCLLQAENNSSETSPALLIIKKNRSKTYSILEYDILKKYIKQDKNIFDITTINRTSFNIWSIINKVEANVVDDRIPLVVFKRNRSKTYAVLEVNELFKLIFDE